MTNVVTSEKQLQKHIQQQESSGENQRKYN